METKLLKPITIFFTCITFNFSCIILTDGFYNTVWLASFLYIPISAEISIFLICEMSLLTHGSSGFNATIDLYVSSWMCACVLKLS